ncbi:MAG: FAD-dependent oxidoreductase [Leptospiraceae bacterium]|nr:FAD-dependent oxidoreductase [Leptospiraceae bacterium]MCP5500506.1 FAD-dependent oxidoreductase [Leptospiraceae bacterium]
MLETGIKRERQIEKLKKTNFDCLIIGGGATGAGAAHDAALRGLTVAIIEMNDFSAGTSSRSTKLIHGGIRYLGQFRFKLIREALRERKKLLNNAPHLVKPLKFVLPTYKCYEKPYYSIGLTLYDYLSGDSGLPYHKRISKDEAIKNIPSIEQEKLRGGIVYYDGQFNDSRLNVYLARAAEQAGATVCNRVSFESFVKENGKITRAVVKDLLSGETFEVKANVFVNTAGVFIDEVRKKDDPSVGKVLAPSQGIHLTFSKERIKCNTAMIIPKTSDGRVVFMIPWEDHVIMGTTDTPLNSVSAEPLPVGNEIDFLLETGNRFLNSKLNKEDILSVFIGIRPLIAAGGEGETKKISREEAILVSDSGLITMGGGKWSTYRQMAEDLVDRIIKEGNLPQIKPCSTHDFKFHGTKDYSENIYLKIMDIYGVSIETAQRLRNFYGGEVFDILGSKPEELLPDSGYFKEEVIHFIKNEFALSLMDVVARRFRILFLNLKTTEALLEPIAKIMKQELNWTKEQNEAAIKEVKTLLEALTKSIS